MTSGGKATTTVDSVRAKTAAAALGLQSGRQDRLDQRHADGRREARSRDTIGASQGKPLSVVVLRERQRSVTLGPQRGDEDRRDAIASGSSSGERALPPPAAVKEAARVTGLVSQGHRDVARQPRHGRGPEGHLEPRRHRPGLVRRRQGGHGQLPLGARPDLALDRAAQPAAVPAARRRAHRLRDRRGHPRPHGPARGLRAGLDRRDRARAAAVRDRAHERHRPALAEPDAPG